jgi:polysaccharide deacetylase 2 family uncharacterized protein YibQ
VTAEPEAPQEEKVKEPYVLPPRRESFLAHYSRRSKFATLSVILVGVVAVSYTLVQVFSLSGAAGTAGHHGAKIVSADEPSDKNHAAEQTEKKGAETTAVAPPTVGGPDGLNQQDEHIALSEAPDPNLIESTPQGDLPRIGEDGRQPWQIYARPFNAADKRPRLAILVADLGLSREVTEAAVSRLPANVTLAFDVQSPVTAAWCGRARQAGHETFISVPMEPFDFPRSDPGPHTLLSSLTNSQNLEKLNWALRRCTGYVGITTMTGSRYTTDSGKLGVVMDTLRQRGLMVLDAHVAPHSAMTEMAHNTHVPVATVNERIDEDLSPEAIDAALQQLEQAARLNGHAVGVVAPLPIVIDRLQQWLHTLPGHGIALAPISAVVQ